MGGLRLSKFIILLCVTIVSCQDDLESRDQPPNSGRRFACNNRNKISYNPAMLKDTFHEDSGFVVRIRTSYNQTYKTCNGILMESNLVLSDITCIKYQDMATIDAKFVHIIAGESSNETIYEVEQIYVNKVDPKDPGTELALLKVSRPILFDTNCINLLLPMSNLSLGADSNVRVIGFTKHSYELKESRTTVAKNVEKKYICTQPANVNDTVGYHLLRGSPLLHMVDCRNLQLVGIFSNYETVVDPRQYTKKHQDCYVAVSSQVRWYDKVKSLVSFAGKKDGPVNQPSVIEVTVEDDETAN